MNITIINDCRDDNAKGRQIARVSSLIEGNISFVGVQSDIEASGNLLDVLDAYQDSPALILVNVAPRNGTAKKWANGTPFGYFWYKNILVVSSIDGYTLSLVKKLNLIQEVNVLDIPTVVERFVNEKILSKETGNYIMHTQFRSYEFLPRIAEYLLKNKGTENTVVESEAMNIKDFPDMPSVVWYVDNFGNCKTTLLKNELQEGENISTKFGNFPYFEKLKDVPDQVSALITGSSGINDMRLVEFVTQGGDTAKKFSINSSDMIL
ncbi:MAG: hypothetical protein K9L98_00975 [Candidatus Pacebacteria bacterium]|nr:hypothetical protein [Candidatus Paceibacterota bacterium]MCF7862568.1 hypothetical protein [Candidatus Paceibacterota bacterium]